MGAVFLLDQAKDLEEVIERLKKLLVTIKKMEAEEYRLFTAWAENILTRGGVSSEKKDEITVILGKTRPEEVEEMISNVERVLKKSWQDAEKQGIEKGMQKVAKQMLSEGENIEKITKYTGLSREVIEKLR